MGICSATGSTVIPYTREQVYDFITNPHNWPKTYKGSGGIQQTLPTPLQLGDQWTEKVVLGPNTYYARWTLITAVKPWKWTFLQENGICATDEAITDGYPGTTEIAYVLEPTKLEVDGKTIEGCVFKRTLTMDQPRGSCIPDDMLAICMKSAGIEGYHDAVARELEKEHGKP
ncbi:hypothetical protein VHEMI02621 [[Torrubiella] hemipterigena]|uniref:Uncharacterized protein n=1 Tax=[Torrubiella] hemipterigena TaxID=1531966 RepID=A0A0A1T8F9_9HYPO|nr:hypothetical protein VHEMI02621 [[Torrubiella] hemipterigena]